MGKTSWIRKRACEDQHARVLLEQVDKLATDIFSKRVPNGDFRYFFRFAPFLAVEHAEAVEDKLDELIFGASNSKSPVEFLDQRPRAFSPTSMECLYLVAAARLRTIGLLWGIFQAERTERASSDSGKLLFDCTKSIAAPWELEGNGIDSDKVLNNLLEFRIRTAQFVQAEWNFNSKWNGNEKLVLATLLTSYFPDEELPDEDAGNVRLRELTCLLRVATCSLLTTNVCPLELRVLLKPDDICDPRKTNLAMVEWIADSVFDPALRQLVIQANVPKRQDIPDPRSNSSSLPVASVDYGHGLQFLVAVIEEVLDSVSPVLGLYSNVAIRNVRLQIARFRRNPTELDRDLPEHWLLPLASAMNGAEVAGMAAAIIQAFCEYGFIQRENEPKVSLAAQVQQVCNVVRLMHPFNALALKLVDEVESDFDWGNEFETTTIATLKARMHEYLIERATIGNGVADYAINEGVLRYESDGTEVDVVLVTHYGRCVLSTLIRAKFKGEVWMVEPAPDAQGKWVPNCSERVVECLKNAGIKVIKIPAGRCFAKLNAIKGKKSIAYLTGTKGMWSEILGGEIDQFICSQGVWNAAAMVRAFGGRAILIAECAKEFVYRETIEAIKQKQFRLQDEIDTRPWLQVEILARSLFDKVVIFNLIDHAALRIAGNCDIKFPNT